MLCWGRASAVRAGAAVSVGDNLASTTHPERPRRVERGHPHLDAITDRMPLAERGGVQYHLAGELDDRLHADRRGGVDRVAHLPRKLGRVTARLTD